MISHANPPPAASSIGSDGANAQRVDRWLCNCRFFKTRGLAVDAIDNGRIDINGIRAKAAKLVKAGDLLRIQRPPYVLEVEVLGLTERRVGASVAQHLYRETSESLAARTLQKAQTALSRVVDAPRHGKLNKHDRRERERMKRWSP